MPKPENYDELSDAEQENYYEDAEIPAAIEWVDAWEQKIDAGSESAEEVAQKLGQWIEKKNRAIERFNAGSAVEMLAATHRTATEPLLVACTGKSLAELGGPLNLAEQWEFTIKTDEVGAKQYQIKFRNIAYEVDWEAVKATLSL